MLKRRSLLGLITLSIITFGIYGIVWFYLMTDSINKAIGEDGKTTDPWLAVLLCIITGGIYTYIWFYMQGERVNSYSNQIGVDVKETGTTYLLWLIVGVLIIIGPLVAYAKFLKNYNVIVTIHNKKIIDKTSGI